MRIPLIVRILIGQFGLIASYRRILEDVLSQQPLSCQGYDCEALIRSEYT